VRLLVRLARWPSLAIAALLSAAILGCTAAVSPLFLTAAGSEIFRSHATRLKGAEALQMRDFNLFVGEFADYRDRLLTEDVPEGLTAPVRMIWSEPISLAGPDGEDSVRAVSRSGAFDHMTTLTAGPKKGLWLSDFNAERIGARASDSVTIEGTFGSIQLEVTGIYRDLIKDPPTDFWAPLGDVIFPRPGDDTRPPAPLIVDRETFFEIARALGDDAGEYRWEFSLETVHLTLPEVQDLATRIEEFNAERVDPRTELGASFLGANFVSLVSGWEELTTEAVASITGPTETIALGGTIVALLIVLGVAFFTVARRRTEFSLLHARGISPMRLGIRSLGEVALPLVIGAVLGWVLAFVFVRAVGPPGLIDRSALVDAATDVAWRTAGTAVLFGIGATLAVRLLAHEGFGRLQRAARLPWEPIVLVLAAAAFYELEVGGQAPVAQAESVPTIDRLVILFPILFISGAAGLAARALRLLLPKLRSRGGSWPASLYLASRRLGAAVRAAAALVTASAIAVGMFYYSATLSASVEATANQRALVQVGADVSASLSRMPEPIDSDAFDSTPVVRMSDGALLPGDEPVDVLAIDPETFADAAYWDREFSDESIDDLMDELATTSEEGVPVILAGDAPEGDLLSLPSYDIPIVVEGRAERFPGMVGERTVIVVSAADLVARIEEGGGSLAGLFPSFQMWSDGTRAALDRALQSGDQPAFAFQTARELRDTPSYLALTWTFGLMKALGILIGVVALLGTLLYLQTRQKERQVSYALSRRMGLARSSHRAAVAMELGAMLIVAVLVGAALAVIAAITTHDQVQIFSDRGVVPLLRFPVLLMVAATAALLAFAWVSAWLVQRAADRLDVAQVMRLAR
jgi:putative ABC transport system permease protein